MTLPTARPDITHLAVSLFERALHPELIVSACRAVVAHAGIRIELALHAAGHLFVVRMGTSVLTEVISDCREMLPENRRCYLRRLRGSADESHQFSEGLQYGFCCSVERLSPATYLRHNEELQRDAAHAVLFSEQPSLSRFSPGALSLLRVEAIPSGFSIHAFHTFPEQQSILKTQTLIERT